MSSGKLNPAQLEAVLHKEGPCCVLAGAGSGKTTVLTCRIGNMVAKQGISPASILAVTFTNKAATEMKDRLATILGTGLESLNIGTFHSICLGILKRDWAMQRIKPYDTLEDYEKKSLIIEILKEMNCALDAASAMVFISNQKNEMITWRDELVGVDFNIQQYRDLYRIYEEKKQQMGKIDFDDMLLMCYQLLAGDSASRARYYAKYRYVLVDEFQDTNTVQHEIIKLWVNPTNNLFVVGDDYQAIYGWRGGRVDFIVDFQKNWPGAKVIKLEINYRSTQNIVEFSNQLIACNLNQVPKNMKAFAGQGSDPIIITLSDEDDEADLVVKQIQEHVHGDQYLYKDCAVLYRTNALSQSIEDALIRSKIPYAIIGGTGFYCRREVRDIVAYISVIYDPDDAEAISRIINVPTRYLGKVFLQSAQKFADSRGISLLKAIETCQESSQGKYWRAREFVNIIRRLQLEAHRLSLSSLVHYIRQLTDYDHLVIEQEGGDDDVDNNRLDNLDSLATAAGKFSSLKDFVFYAKQAGQRKNKDDNGDKVRLMTLHRSKGLEFGAVFMIGCNAGILPHKRSIEHVDGKIVPSSAEEERRLFYVGMTRARKFLYMIMPEEYHGRPMEPSMFLYEVPTGMMQMMQAANF